MLFVDILAITNLKPYTKYTVRMAAINDVGQGQFSVENTVRTEGKRKFNLLQPAINFNVLLLDFMGLPPEILLTLIALSASHCYRKPPNQ